MLKGMVFVMIGLIALLSITTFCFAQDTGEQLTITTYYPSPYGVYKTLRLYPNADANVYVDQACTNPGEMSYSTYSDLDQEALHVPLFCDGSISPHKWRKVGDLRQIFGDFINNGPWSRTVNEDGSKIVTGWVEATALPDASVRDEDTNTQDCNLHLDEDQIPAALLTVSFYGQVKVTGGETVKKDVVVQLQTKRKRSGLSDWNTVVSTEWLRAKSTGATYDIDNSATFLIARDEDWREFRLRVVGVRNDNITVEVLPGFKIEVYRQ